MRAAVAVIGAGLAYLAAKSQRNSRDQQAVIEFRAYRYRKEGDDPEGKIDLSAPAMLSRSEVEQYCKALSKVQEYTDEAAKSVNARELRENKYMSASQYGTAVHKALKDIIEALKSNPYNLSAEISFAKTQEVNYGTKDSIRIDVHEPLRPITLCVYDIKTGDEARNIVSPTRAAEIAKNMTEKGYIRLLITEIRSRVPRNPPF